MRVLSTKGATISALFEPDMDINIEVNTGVQGEKLTVPNSTSVMALKVQICGVMRCGVVPENLEIKLEDVTLEDPMPLHFYEIKDGTKLETVKPFVNVTITNNHGGSLFWRLHRNDTIKEVKAKLATAQSRPVEKSEMETTYDRDISWIESVGHIQNGGCISTDGMRLYSIACGENFHELDL